MLKLSTTKPQPIVPYHATPMEPLPSTSLCLTANIGKNSAVIRVYNNFATVKTQMLQVTISNMPNLETQLFQLYIEVTAILHDLMPEEDDEMPPLENLTDDRSDTDLVV